MNAAIAYRPGVQENALGRDGQHVVGAIWRREREPAVRSSAGPTGTDSAPVGHQFSDQSEHLDPVARHEAPAESPILDSARPLLGPGEHHRVSRCGNVRGGLVASSAWSAPPVCCEAR